MRKYGCNARQSAVYRDIIYGVSMSGGIADEFVE